MRKYWWINDLRPRSAVCAGLEGESLPLKPKGCLMPHPAEVSQFD